MTVLKELLAIKSFRESKAELAMFRQRSVLQDAVKQKNKAEKLLNEFHIYASEHERSLYADLCSRLVRLHDIENVQLSVVDLRTKESKHAQDMRDAESERINQAEILEEDKKNHAEAARVKQKFIELLQVYDDEKSREFERKEDAEIEEVNETRRDRDGWGDDDNGMEA
jgi:hypothetical protein